MIRKFDKAFSVASYSRGIRPTTPRMHCAALFSVKVKGSSAWLWLMTLKMAVTLMSLVSSQTFLWSRLLQQISFCLWFCLSLTITRLLYWALSPPQQTDRSGRASVWSIWGQNLSLVFQKEESNVSCQTKTVKPTWTTLTSGLMTSPQNR